MIKKLTTRALASLLFLLPFTTTALEFDEIRDFGDVFVISATAVASDRIEVRWDIAEDYYLYHNKFLSFATDTPGVVIGEPEVPEGKESYDKLLEQDVIKFYESVVVGLPLLTVPEGTTRVNLKVRSQGCLEDVLCYPPTRQMVSVELPAGGQTGGLLDSSAATSSILGIAGQDALPPEQAFVYEAIGFAPGTVLVRFTAQDGYYLYRDKFKFSLDDGSGFEVRDIELPEGTLKDDPEFGPVQVYFGQVEIPVHINRPAGGEQTITLTANYQGCRDGDICYPPQTTALDVLVEASAQSISDKAAETGMLVAEAAVAVSEQDALARMLVNNPAGAMAAFFIAGLLLAFTPCVFPMIPILSGIIVGQGERMTTARSFWLSLVYVLAMALTYTLAGVLAGLFGQNLQALFQNPWILGFFIAVFVALALSMFGFYELQVPAALQTKLSNASNRQQGRRRRDGLPVGPDRRAVRRPAAGRGADRHRRVGRRVARRRGIVHAVHGHGPAPDPVRRLRRQAGAEGRAVDGRHQGGVRHRAAGAGHLDARAHRARPGHIAAVGRVGDRQRRLPGRDGAYTGRRIGLAEIVEVAGPGVAAARRHGDHRRGFGRGRLDEAARQAAVNSARGLRGTRRVHAHQVAG